MDESFKSLRETVLKAVKEAQELPKENKAVMQKRFLLEFIRVQLRKTEQSETEFAKYLNISPEDLANGFQNCEIDKSTLEKIAQAIHCDVSLLGIILEGSSNSTTESPSSDFASSTD